MMVAIAILPVIVVYLLLSKFIVRGVAPKEGAASASRTRDPTSIRHIAGQTIRATRAHLPVIGNAARLHANELRPFPILLPYYNSRQPWRRPAPGCLLFFPIYKTELNQYNKVRSIKHRRRPS